MVRALLPRVISMLLLVLVIACAGRPAPAPHRGHALRQRIAMSELRAIATALDEYERDHRAPLRPRESRGLVENLRIFLEPIYIRKLPLIDPWKRPYYYATHEGHLEIRSLGKDGRWEDLLAGGPREGHAFDLVVFRGSFQQWPPGT